MDRLNRLYLARHGQVVGHDEIMANGHTDVGITEVGKLQMENLAERLKLTELKAIYSSDLKRSVIGARIISRNHDVPLNSLPEFREICFGEWEGLPLSEIRKQYPDELYKRQADSVNYHPPGGGENVLSLRKRVMGSLNVIFEEQKGNDILLVAHGMVNRVILCNALGLDLSKAVNIHQKYGCLNIIDYYPGSTLVRLING